MKKTISSLEELNEYYNEYILPQQNKNSEEDSHDTSTSLHDDEEEEDEKVPSYLQQSPFWSPFIGVLLLIAGIILFIYLFFYPFSTITNFISCFLFAFGFSLWGSSFIIDNFNESRKWEKYAKAQEFNRLNGIYDILEIPQKPKYTWRELFVYTYGMLVLGGAAFFLYPESNVQEDNGDRGVETVTVTVPNDENEEDVSINKKGIATKTWEKDVFYPKLYKNPNAMLTETPISTYSNSPETYSSSITNTTRNTEEEDTEKTSVPRSTTENGVSSSQSNQTVSSMSYKDSTNTDRSNTSQHNETNSVKSSNTNERSPVENTSHTVKTNDNEPSSPTYSHDIQDDESESRKTPSGSENITPDIIQTNENDK